MPQLDALGLTNETGAIKIGGTYSLGDALGATFDEALSTNPFESLLRWSEIDRARNGDVDPIMGEFGEMVRTGPKTSGLSAEEQMLRLAREELTGKLDVVEGETEEGLDIRIKYKREEIDRKAVLSNAPDGVSTALAQFGVGLAASFLDPLNVASAFVPVIGPARYAALLAKQSSAVGRFGVRTAVGASEGLVGAALVEPIVLAGTSATGADYDIYNTFANLAFGTVLGGGMHGIGGLVKDTVSARRLQTTVDAVGVETRQAAFRAAIGQMGEGRIPVGIDNVLRMDLEAGPHMDTSTGRSTVTGLEGTTSTAGSVHATASSSAAEGEIPVQTSFRTEAQAATAAKKLEKEGLTTTVRKTGDDDFRIDIEIPVDAFVRGPDGDFISFPTAKEANAAIKQLAKEGVGAGVEVHVVQVRDEFLIVSDVSPSQLAALKASANEIVLPVELPSRQPGADPNSGINADNMLDDVNASQADTNLVGDAQERATHEAADRSRTELPELDTPEAVNAELDLVMAELDRVLDVVEPRVRASDDGVTEFMGASKVVDDAGEPATVYHGTGEKFDSFDMEKSADGKIWFAGSRAEIDAGEAGAAGSGHVVEVNLRIEKPASFDDVDKFSDAELIQKGFDGYILDDGDTVTYAVFEADQIRIKTDDAATASPEAGSVRAEIEADLKAADLEIKKAQELDEGLKQAAFCVIGAAA